MSRTIIRLLRLAPLLALALTACGDDDSGGSANGPAPQADGEPSAEHVHGLGVTPDDGTLYIATHSGLFAAPAGETDARPVGESRQDIMGFSVVDPKRFIGSGHPAPDQQLPPNLGLIQSSDGGKRWSSVSLSGEADFHVLESAGRQIYGFDGTQGRLMVSDNGGRSWAERAPPAPMFALAIEPGDERRVVAATQTGLHVSNDGGKRWRGLRNDLAGLLAWPSVNNLYLVDGEGAVQTSVDAGRIWRRVGDIGGQPAAFLAEGRELYAALADGTVKRSSDGGTNWSVRATP